MSHFLWSLWMEPDSLSSKQYFSSHDWEKPDGDQWEVYIFTRIIKNRSQPNLDKSNQRGTKLGWSFECFLIKTKICKRKRNVTALYLNHHFSQNKITLFPFFAKTTNPFLFMFLFTECIYLNGKHRNTQNGQNRKIVPDLFLVLKKEEFLDGVQLGS